MGGYIITVSGTRLCKHVPAATVTHATGETVCCLSGPSRGCAKSHNWGNIVKLIVGSQFCTGVGDGEHRSRGIAIVRSCYQETSSNRLEKTSGVVIHKVCKSAIML
jgi:hypothetical protein